MTDSTPCRDYTVTIRPHARNSVTFTISAPSWLEAWMNTLEQYGHDTPIKVGNRYYLIEVEGRKAVVGDFELETEFKGTHVRAYVEADCWLEAKAKLNLPLAPHQEKLLALRRAAKEAIHG
jgi:hypothetical protein